MKGQSGPICPADSSGTSPKVQWVLRWALESDTCLGTQVFGRLVLQFPPVEVEENGFTVLG